jgi:hypothetical protein
MKMLKKTEVRIYKLKKNNEGAASIVAAVLIIGIFISFLSFIQINQIPDWTEEREAEHMEHVANQFTHLKFAADMLSTIDKSGNKFTTDITLGTKEIPMPFLKSSNSYGFLKLLDDECQINVTDQSSNSYSYPLGSVKYSSRNTEYVNMEYIYEAGGIIINQKSGNVMFSMPYFSVDYGSTVDISYDTINFIEVSGKKYTTGYVRTPLQIEYLRRNISSLNNVDTIKIITEYPKAWYNFLNSSLSSSGLEYGPSNDYIIIETDDETSIDFNNALTINLDINIAEINIQIGPGWINK